jgi:hypothetical protein
MKLRTMLAMSAMAAALLLQTTPSHANADESCTVAGGSADTPHLIDGFGDTLLTADTDPTIEGLDPTDLLAGWFSRSEDGVLTANMKVQNLVEPLANVVYYMLWDFKGTDDAIKTTRWISVQPRPSLPAESPIAYGPRYRYGYLDKTTVGVQTLVAEGDSTGAVSYGSPGAMSIVVPLAKMGNPGPGDLLSNLVMQARVLIGSPGLPPGYSVPPPPPPAPSIPGGLVSTTDDTTDALEYCSDVEV